MNIQGFKAAMNTVKQVFCGHRFLICASKYTGVELLGCRVGVCLML